LGKNEKVNERGGMTPPGTQCKWRGIGGKNEKPVKRSINCTKGFKD